MNKFIKSYLTAFFLLTAVVINGCDIFESFQFGLPITMNFESEGATPLGEQSFCFNDNETYREYQDDINSINFVAAYLVTIDVTPENPTLSGDVHLKLYEGTDAAGQLLFEHVAADLIPSEHDSTNAYKIELTNSEISNINASLAGGSRCFFGVYEIQNVQGATSDTQIKVKVDALFNVDAKLD